MITVFKSLFDFSSNRDVLEPASHCSGNEVPNGFVTIKKKRRPSGQIEWQDMVTREIGKGHSGEKFVKDSTYTFHLLYLTCPPPSTLIPSKWNTSALKEWETPSAKGSSRMMIQHFPLHFSHSLPFHPELGVPKTPKVLKLCSHWLSLTIVGRDGKEVCMNFSKPFFWFKQKAKEMKESVWCTKHRLWFSFKTCAHK